MSGSRPSAEPARVDARVAEADALLLGDERRGADVGGAYRLYAQLASDGSAEAAQRAAVLSAQGVGRIADWGTSLDWVLHGALAGDRTARRQLAVLAGRTEPRVASGEASGAALWRDVRASIDIEALLTPPQAQVLNESPMIRVVRGFAPPQIAAWLIKTAQTKLQAGLVHDVATGHATQHTMRTAQSASMNIRAKDVVVLAMQERAARATGVPITCHEPPNVISYMPGQQFEPHYDYVDPAVPHFQLELMLQGQRVVTCVTYLNDDFDGAETEFPRLRRSFRGKIGDVVIFHNVTPDGKVDPRTLHAGRPPTRGRKWVLSQWLRDRTQPAL